VSSLTNQSCYILKSPAAPGEIPSNLVLKKFRPSRWIPAIVILWAIVQICMGLVKTYGQLLALRFLLGLFECGLFPGRLFSEIPRFFQLMMTWDFRNLLLPVWMVQAKGGVQAYLRVLRWRCHGRSIWVSPALRYHGAFLTSSQRHSRLRSLQDERCRRQSRLVLDLHH
jgi:hypothetical protein